MKFLADFHIHSHFSMATSKKSLPEYLDAWAQLKGLTVMGTGDFIHPGWLGELEERLVPAEEGLFRLKNDFILPPEEVSVPESCRQEMRFLLTAEVSSIYKRGGKTRKVHNLIVAPSFEAAGKVQTALDKRGNIRSDGRPILGVDSRDILEIVLEAGEGSFLIPAHVWTPWFSVLGSKSGFDTIEECYDDLAEHVFCLETGLSSDPEMNWMCSRLDGYTLVSNSDAHSPEKIGREANRFNCDLSFPAIRQALEDGDGETFQGTIEFFPQEGKYHYDGHRKCNVCLNPLDSVRQRFICPECGKKLTVGVMSRVAELADRDPQACPVRLPFSSITALPNLLSEVLGKGEKTKTVRKVYQELLERHGNEFHLLLETPLEEIAAGGHPRIAEGLGRMRNREAYVEDGYDGEFGAVRFFPDDEQADCPRAHGSVEFDVEEFKKLFAALRAEEEHKKSENNGEQLTFF